MKTTSPYEQYEVDQTRYASAIDRQQTAGNRLSKLFHTLRAEYLGILVQEDLEAVELVEFNSIPQQRSTQQE